MDHMMNEYNYIILLEIRLKCQSNYGKSYI